jgi:hypothetical protein
MGADYACLAVLSVGVLWLADHAGVSRRGASMRLGLGVDAA